MQTRELDHLLVVALNPALAHELGQPVGEESSSVEAELGEVGHEEVSIAADDEEDVGGVVDALQASELLQQRPVLDVHGQLVKSLRATIPNSASTNG